MLCPIGRRQLVRNGLTWTSSEIQPTKSSLKPIGCRIPNLHAIACPQVLLSIRKFEHGHRIALKQMTAEVRKATSIAEVLEVLTEIPESASMDIVLASAAWVALARHPHQFNSRVCDSEEFMSLVKSSVVAITAADSRWRESAKRHPKGGSVGIPHATMLWALSELYQRHQTDVFHELLPSLLRSLKANAMVANTQNVANAVWSLGILKLAHGDCRQVVVSLARRAFALVHQLNDQEIANICWGLACTQYRDYPLCQAITGRLTKIAPSLPSKTVGLSLSMTACAMARLQFRDDAFFQSVALHIESLLFELPNWNICALALALIELYPSPGDMGTNRHDGVWRDRGVIRGDKLIWDAGRVAILSFTESGEPTCIDREGNACTAQLAEDADVLVWSDGDIWHRMEIPVSSFKRRVLSEVSRRSLEGQVLQSSLGPGMWYSLYGTD